eukprot:TRINITY_DN7430_c0_g1_i1.p1 TRINITY_DN7430_c0_g1~~TRINITY_DN7430_c0_g1_i1.p1  ORF type:complete len:585 (+),score=180.38 TRINITY_DN7430_c0_g1_i1:59-1813(+)
MVQVKTSVVSQRGSSRARGLRSQAAACFCVLVVVSAGVAVVSKQPAAAQEQPRPQPEQPRPQPEQARPLADPLRRAAPRTTTPAVPATSDEPDLGEVTAGDASQSPHTGRLLLPGWDAVRRVGLRSLTVAALSAAAASHAPAGKRVGELWTVQEVGGRAVRVELADDADVAEVVTSGGVIHGSLRNPPAPDPDACPAQPRKYHTVMTTGPGTYERWQGRVMYWWYKQHRSRDPCGEMGGFTRLMYGQADPYMEEIPTVVVPAVKNDYGFVVLNRPHSFWEWLRRVDSGKIKLEEEYVLLCEPDHLMLKPLPNTAPLGFHFYYMHAAEAKLEDAILPHLPQGASPFSPDLPPTGPSPCLMHVDDWRRVTPSWHDISFALKRDKRADKAFGWVLEMWGFIAALVKEGVWVNVTGQLQCEPNSGYPALHSDYVATESQLEQWTRRRSLGPFFLHLTFEMAFYGNGSAWQPGVTAEEKAHRGRPDWNWNKRNYYGKYPPQHLAYPPSGSVGGKHVPAATVVEMYNEATATMRTWGKETGTGRGTCEDKSDAVTGGDASARCGGGRRRGMIRKLRLKEEWPRSGVRDRV